MLKINNNQRKMIFTITCHYNYHELVVCIKRTTFLKFVRIGFVYVIHLRLFLTKYRPKKKKNDQCHGTSVCVSIIIHYYISQIIL